MESNSSKNNNNIDVFKNNRRNNENIDNRELIHQMNILRKEIAFLTKMMVSLANDEGLKIKRIKKIERDIIELRKENKNLRKRLNNKNNKENDSKGIFSKDKIIRDLNSDIIVQIEPIEFGEKNSDSNMNTLNPFDKIFDMLFKKNKDNKKDNKTDETETIEENETIDDNVKVEDMDINIKCLDDLIKLGELYVEKKGDMNITTEHKPKKYTNLYELNGKYYPINLETINKLSVPLQNLKSMIGLEKVKNSILDMILYYIQNFEKSNKNMLHTVIEGPPGVGKTELGRIIAQIYASMGVIKSDKFKVVRRTDLIGEYVGHTAHKTQRVIDEANGGVLFIDEAYSLGSNEGKDSFSKECIDTINQNLSEQKKNLIVIIAGYPNELEKCFFSFNPGLGRRFPFRYNIEGYNETELKDIFLKKVKDMKWNIDDNIEKEFIQDFFKTNLSKFCNYGGDIENLITMCKFCHSRRVIGKHPKYKRILNSVDITNGMNKFMEMKKSKQMDYYFRNMYL
ncbi:AAA family ATPase [Catovirus CTV1]|uniref:AAA family ATPase n=1 Tax=Catovirus CTV1 TaxID=1977631 RepID=A0A1V0SB36_9VIRU|nr:AAA family ATPase [Catovirus CTV1]